MPILLPPNASELERALDDTTARIGSIPVLLRDLWNPQRCPEALLPWLAWALSVDYWDSDWTEEVKRQVIACSVLIHRRKGTVWSVRDALRSSGYADAIITERVASNPALPATDWARYSINLDIGDNQGVSASSLQRARDLVEQVQPARCHLASFDAFRSTIEEQISVSEVVDSDQVSTASDTSAVNRAVRFDGTLSADGEVTFDGERDRMTFEVTTT